jgi:Leucine-rich repeat (LRR) protein
MSAIKQINNLKNYFISKTSTSSLHKAIVSADKNLSALNLSGNNFTDLQTQA